MTNLAKISLNYTSKIGRHTSAQDNKRQQMITEDNTGQQKPTKVNRGQNRTTYVNIGQKEVN